MDFAQLRSVLTLIVGILYTFFSVLFIVVYARYIKSPRIAFRSPHLALISATSGTLFVLYFSIRQLILARECSFDILWFSAVSFVSCISPYFLRSIRLFVYYSLVEEEKGVRTPLISRRNHKKENITFIKQAPYVWILCALVLFVAIAIIAFNILISEKCIGPYSCTGIATFTLHLLAALTFISALILIFLSWKMRKFDDEFSIHVELASVAYFAVVCMVVYLILVLLGYNYPEYPYVADVFGVLVIYSFFPSLVMPVWKCMRNAHPDTYLLADSSEDVSLISFLTQEERKPAFSEFLARSFLVFDRYLLDEVKEFRENFDIRDLVDNEHDARRIVESYIVLTAPLEVIIDGEVRDELISMHEGGVVDIDMFQRLETTLERQFRVDIFPRFLRSASFRRWKEYNNMERSRRLQLIC